MKDLNMLLGLTVLSAIFILVPPFDQTPVRTVLGLILTLFLPGYALIAALFPGREDIGVIERVALSFGLSIAVVPLMGLVLNYTPFGIREIPVLATVCLFTVLCTLIAYARRLQLEEKNRFEIVIPSMSMPSKNIDGALTVILVLAIIASIGALVYVIVTPKQGEKFTEFYILGPGGMADNYPTDLKAGQNGTVIIGVVNREYEQTAYGIAVDYNGTVMYKENIELGHEQKYETNYTFSIQNNGTGKLEFLLYKDDIKEPYRSLHLWVKVSS